MAGSTSAQCLNYPHAGNPGAQQSAFKVNLISDMTHKVLLRGVVCSREEIKKTSVGVEAR